MKTCLSFTFLITTAMAMFGCSLGASELKLESCETASTQQEKIDCRVRNKKIIDDYAKDNPYLPMSQQRQTRTN